MKPIQKFVAKFIIFVLIFEGYNESFKLNPDFSMSVSVNASYSIAEGKAKRSLFGVPIRASLDLPTNKFKVTATLEASENHLL